MTLPDRLHEFLYLLYVVAFVVLLVLWWGVLPCLGCLWILERMP